MDISDKKINNLLALLKTKPRNAKLMANISFLYLEKDKDCKTNQNSNNEYRLKAISWAKKSITRAPEKPYGYAALSEASYDRKERIMALTKLVNFSSSNMNKPYSYAVSLFRLLLENRSIDVDVAEGKHRSNQRKRNNLNEYEHEIYNNLLNELVKLNQLLSESDSKPDGKNIFFIFKIEYSLAMLFRRLNPPNVHRPRSQNHFNNVITASQNICTINFCSAVDCKEINSFAQKSKFWLATFQISDNLLNESNGTNERNDLSTSYKDDVHRCPDEYIISLYSNFAPKFDQLLVSKLKYKTPSLIRSLVDSTIVKDIFLEKTWSTCCVDLGCGTGLSGLAFRDCTEFLIGVDLSQDMIDVANKNHPSCYDQFLVNNVETAIDTLASCANWEQNIDLVIACDVFVYIGDLRIVFESIRKHLVSTKGRFAFSTELLHEDDKAHGYVLQSSGRFSHKKSYLEKLVKSIGFSSEAIKICAIRKNAGKDVMGVLMVLSLA